VPSVTQIQNEASDTNCLEIVFATNSLVENVHRTVQILTNTDKPRLIIFVSWWVENSNLEYNVMNPCKKFKKIIFKKILGTVYTFGVGSKGGGLNNLHNQYRDQLLKLVQIILCVESRHFFFSVKIFKIETFPVHTRSCQDLHWDYLNKWRQSRLFETIKIIWDL
jgi:hypothetical protein